MNAREARTSEASHLRAACAENHQGSRFLSAAAPVHVVPSSPPAPSLCCECQSPHSRGFAAPGPSPDSGRHRRLYFVASSDVINGARRSFVYFFFFFFFPRRVSLRGVGWGGREPVVGDGAFEQHSFRRKTGVVVVAQLIGEGRRRRLAGPVSS